MRCPRCLSSNISPYKAILWKCADPPDGCGAVFRTPLPDARVTEPNSAESQPSTDTGSDNK